MLEARINLDEGAPLQAEAQLTEIVNEDGDLSPKAILALVNSKLQRNEAVPERIIEIVSTYAYERRDHSEGVELKIAEIKSLASASRFDEVFAQFESIGADYNPNRAQREELLNHVFRQLVDNGADAKFLRYSVGYLPDASALTEGLRTDMAHRLLQLGFLQRARDILDVEVSVPKPEQRLIFALIGLKQDKPEVALGYLAGLDTPGADLLRAEALMKANQPEAASLIYRNLDAASQQRADFHARSWQSLAQNGSNALRETGELLANTENRNIGSEQGLLSQSTELLQQSELARGVLKKLLTEFPVPD